MPELDCEYEIIEFTEDDQFWYEFYDLLHDFSDIVIGAIWFFWQQQLYHIS